jgi:hypothetical protein
MSDRLHLPDNCPRTAAGPLELPGKDASTARKQPRQDVRQAGIRPGADPAWGSVPNSLRLPGQHTADALTGATSVPRGVRKPKARRYGFCFSVLELPGPGFLLRIVPAYAKEFPMKVMLALVTPEKSIIRVSESSSATVRLRPTCFIQASAGLVVQPAKCTRRVATSMTKSR